MAKPIVSNTPGKPVSWRWTLVPLTRAKRRQAIYCKKWVHNGIELRWHAAGFVEAYHLLRSLLGYEPGEIGKIIEKWNQGFSTVTLWNLADNFTQLTIKTGAPLVDMILDSEDKKKGTWALDIDSARSNGLWRLVIISESVMLVL